MDPNARFQFQPTLAGPTLGLRPLVQEDLDDLYAIASDPLLWELHPQPDRWKRPVFEKFFAAGIASGGALLATANDTGRVVGTSRFYYADFPAREMTIGYTFLARSRWGTGDYREMKDLMLRHAFRWVDTVWFHIGKHNFRSRGAMEKIGGKFDREETEEILGVVRESVFYRIERCEWDNGISSP